MIIVTITKDMSQVACSMLQVDGLTPYKTRLKVLD